MHNPTRARNRWLSNIATTMKTRLTLTGELRCVVSFFQEELTTRLGDDATKVVDHLNTFMVQLEEEGTGQYKLYLRLTQAELERLFPNERIGIMMVQEILALQARRQLHLRTNVQLRHAYDKVQHHVYH